MPNEVSLLSSGMKRALSKFNSTYIKWERIPVMLGRHTMLMSLIRCVCRCFNRQQQYCTAPAAFQDCLHMARALMCRGPSAAALLLSSLLTLSDPQQVIRTCFAPMTFFAPSFLSTVFTVLQVKSAFPFKIQRISIIYRDSIYL